MDLGLTTLGGLRVECDGRELDWLAGQRARAALLIYLAVERRTSRTSLATIFWPESDEARARQSLRQALHHLRKVLDVEWVESLAHELRVLDAVHTDTAAFSDALVRGDAGAAARLYRGPFLDGVDLIDVKPWESWVDGRRALYAREFRKACRSWVAERHDAGDMASAIEAARHWVTPDPLDDEAQHRLIQLLSDAGERADAIRQYETYLRLLDTEGLRPLDETVQLMDRIRAEPVATTSANRAPSVAAPPSVGVTAPDEAALPEPPRRAAPSPSPRRAPRPWRPRSARVPAALRPLRPLLATGAVLVLLVLLAPLWLFGPGRLYGPGAPAASAGDEQRPGIVLADFATPASDPTLGEVVTNVLRSDLQAGGEARVLDAAHVRDVLQRMQADADVPLGPELAREVALRQGAKAVLQGSVARVGSGWVLSASLHAATTGRMLASYRETALTPQDLIPAIDRLGTVIRRNAGESLQAIAAAPPLAPVTTSSLAALRVFADAERAIDRRDFPRAADLLEEAIALDPDFAMAWRLLAAALANTQADSPRQLQAAQRAWELRDRLPPRERHLAAAAYHQNITRDWNATSDHYRSVLAIQPHDETALNNLALLLQRAGDFDAAAELLERGLAGRSNAVRSLNLVRVHVARGQLADARAAAVTLGPDDALSRAEAQFVVRMTAGDTAGARAAVLPLLDIVRSPRERAWAHDRLARLALWRGSLQVARSHFHAAERIAMDAGSGLNPLAWRISHAHAEAVLGDPARSVDLLLGQARLPDGEQPAAGPLRDHQALTLAFAGRHRDAELHLDGAADDGTPEIHRVVRMRAAIARALIAVDRGHATAAVTELEAIRAAEACRYCGAAVMGHALLRAGRARAAATEWQHALEGRDTFEDFGFMLVSQLWVMKQLPELYERLGERRAALHHHRRLIGLWRHADPELQPIVQRSRDRIRVLESLPRVSAVR